MSEKVVNLFPPISRKELKLLKALREEDKIFEFSFYMYNKREALLKDADLSDLTYFLKEIKIDVNACLHKDIPLLFLAIENFSPAVVQFLINNGANLSLKNENGESPLEYAERLLEKALEKGRNEKGHIISCARETISVLKTT